MTRRIPLTTLCALLLTAPAAAETRMEDTGRLERLAVGKGWVRVRTDVLVYSRGWSRSAALSAARDRTSSTAGDGTTWSATVSPAQGVAARIRQTARPDGSAMKFEISATGDADGDIECIVFNVSLPTAQFATGQLAIGQQKIALPAKLPDPIHLFNGPARSLSFTDAAGKVTVHIAAPSEPKITVQDGRKWGQEFTAMVFVHSGHLPRGAAAGLSVEVRATGEVDLTPAAVAVDPSSVRYRLLGIGGNYCFNIESPVTAYTLENLNVAVARTEISMRLWAPHRIESADDRDWKPFAVADTPDSRLRRELLLMQRFSRAGIPYASSIWRMPLWMATPLGQRQGNQVRVRIAEENWPHVLRALGTYLLYAKEKYGAEPDWFCFNEPDIGVDVLLTPEEHRDAMKRVGAHFAALGLKTKWMVADAAGPRGTHVYAAPAVADAEAMKHAGAVSFHSWNGASPEQYGAWAELAAKVNLPLMVAEAGVDPFAWQGGRYRTFAYAVREMSHYAELLLHARPQYILLWEYTGDYSLLASDRAPSRLVLTERFCFQKHWCDLTPRNSEALAVTTSGPVLATAFRFNVDGRAGLTIHLANPEWQREVSIAGIPRSFGPLRIYRTSRGELFRESGPVAPTAGTAEPIAGKIFLTLPAESLTSLTTLSATPPKPIDMPSR